MKYLGLLAAVAIIYLIAGQMRSTGDASKSSIAKAEAEAALVDPSAARKATSAGQPVAATPATAGASLRKPLDRTREVTGMVKQRNGAGEF